MQTIQKRSLAERLITTLVAIFPLGILIIQSWINALLFACALISIYILIKQNNSNSNQEISSSSNKWFILIAITLASSLVAILISQSLRQSWQIKDYDGPSRLLIAIPIVYVIWKHKISVIKYWQYIFPAMLIVTFIAIPFLPKTGWVALIPDRLTTFFVNQIIFGRICLTFGLLSLLSINLIGKDRWSTIIFKLIGTALGFYFSIKSETRSIWIVIPVVFIFFLWLNGPKNKILSTTTALLISFSLMSSVYMTSPIVQKRIAEVVSDISSYKMYEMNPDTSIGIRISSARMAWYYFNLRPLSGWGDKGFKSHINDAEISVYASEFTRNHPFAGFHNEFTNSAVKSGIWGLLSTILLFFVPLALFASAWRKGIAPRLAAIGVTYVLCELVGSITLEIFELKFTTSLYALFVASLTGLILAEMSASNSATKD